MSAAIVTTRRPRFLGAVSGEVLKVSRQLSFWLMLAAALVLYVVIVLAIVSAGPVKDQVKADPTGFAYTAIDAFGTIFQIGSGIFLLIVGSRLFGMEYSSGTIRIIYARGMGRLRLLLAKVLTLAIVGVALLAAYVALSSAVMLILVNVWTGSSDALTNLPSAFWRDLELWAAVMGVSMGIAILLSAAAAGLGRSLSFAMAASLAFFPVDNFAPILLFLGSRITKQDHPWLDISQYLLGPNLNVLLNHIQPDHRARPFFSGPLLPVDGTHAAVVVGCFALLFAAVAVARTARPDVLE